jgi:hypothetical protein
MYMLKLQYEVCGIGSTFLGFALITSPSRSPLDNGPGFKVSLSNAYYAYRKFFSANRAKKH